MTDQAAWQRAYDPAGEPQGRNLLSQCEAIWRWKRDERMQFVPMMTPFFSIFEWRRKTGEQRLALSGDDAAILLWLLVQWRRKASPFTIDTAEIADALGLTRRTVQRRLAGLARLGVVDVDTSDLARPARVSMEPLRRQGWKRPVTVADLPPIEGPIGKLGYKSIWLGAYARQNQHLAFTAVPENLLVAMRFLPRPATKLVLLVAAVLHGPAATRAGKPRRLIACKTIMSVVGLKRRQALAALSDLVQVGILHRDDLGCDCDAKRSRGGYHFSLDAFAGINDVSLWEEIVKRRARPLAKTTLLANQARSVCSRCRTEFVATIDVVQTGDVLKKLAAAAARKLKSAHVCRSDSPRR